MDAPLVTLRRAITRTIVDLLTNFVERFYVSFLHSRNINSKSVPRSITYSNKIFRPIIYDPLEITSLNLSPLSLSRKLVTPLVFSERWHNGCVARLFLENQRPILAHIVRVVYAPLVTPANGVILMSGRRALNSLCERPSGYC